MAKSKRKASNAQPITAHPLFPAVVALWFGALFGLGSLAVRPSLLEAAVIASRIDLLIPAAAPPLGVTARILVALGMSALGSALGLMIARRITRPKVEVRQRKRTGVAREEAAPLVRARDAHPDAPARRPISAHDELNTEDSPNGGVLAGRRRALAVELPEEAFVPHEMAPLPGAAPQIFEIADLELGAGMGDPVQDAAPLDLGSFAQPAAAEAPAPVQNVALDWSAARPTAATFDAPMELPAAMQAPGQAAGQAPAQQLHNAQQFEPPVDDFAAPPRQIFGMTATDDHVPQEFVQAAGFKTTVFDVEEAQPLFTDRAPEPAEPLDFTRPTSVAAAAEPMVQLANAPESAPVAAAAALPPAEQLPPLSSLGMTDLAARLAESMLRRRAARAEQAAPAVPELAEPAPLAVEPEPYTPFAQYASTEPLPAPFAKPAPAVEAEAEVAAVVEVAAVAEAPVALARLSVSEPGPAPVEAPPAPIAMPAALRPLTLDDGLADDDDDVLASLLPPRHLAMSVAQAEPELPEPEAAEPEVAAEDEALGAEDKCGSLLDLGLSALSRPQFVRIEEPEADAAAFEPVVIFPGQAPLGVAQAAPFAAAAPGSYAPAAQAFSPSPAPFAAPADSAPFRQFDAPTSLGAGQPVVNPAAAAALDPAETERALRAALSNLQRMSGAA